MSKRGEKLQADVLAVPRRRGGLPAACDLLGETREPPGGTPRSDHEDPDPAIAERSMNQDTDTAHAEQLHQGQGHHRWRQEHMDALAILKHAEAAIFVHEAHILAHDTEIARREEQIAHGDAHADAPPEAEHARFAQGHAAGAEHHRALLEAIRALEAHLGGVV